MSVCNLESEDLYHFVLRCPYLRNDWTRFWMILKNILIQSNTLESELLLLFLRNLSDTCKLRFLTKGLKLPFSIGLCETREISGCINAENLQDTTGSPGRDTSKSLENINYLFISLVITLLVLFFAGTYFHDDKITINYVCYYRGFPKQMLDFPSKIFKTACIIILKLSKTAKSVEFGTSEN